VHRNVLSFYPLGEAWGQSWPWPVCDRHCYGISSIVWAKCYGHMCFRGRLSSPLAKKTPHTPFLSSARVVPFSKQVGRPSWTGLDPVLADMLSPMVGKSAYLLAVSLPTCTA